MDTQQFLDFSLLWLHDEIYFDPCWGEVCTL